METVLLIILIILLTINLVLNYKQRSIQSPVEEDLNVRDCIVEKPKLSEEDKKKIEKTKNAFNNLMNYDEKQAIRGKVNGD